MNFNVTVFILPKCVDTVSRFHIATNRGACHLSHSGGASEYSQFTENTTVKTPPFSNYVSMSPNSPQESSLKHYRRNKYRSIRENPGLSNEPGIK